MIHIIKVSVSKQVEVSKVRLEKSTLEARHEDACFQPCVWVGHDPRCQVAEVPTEMTKERSARRQTDGRQQRRTSKHESDLVVEELVDNELRGAVGVDGQQDAEDSALARSSGSGKIRTSD
ncbi:hypothetical protein Syun_027871 [Stephania yunnanensis]|uniref:Uncharacterized protein n=1 Tax=Stephania yunnanensis TaxID=152371 RepID=A0AAP0EIT0_9MAGN